MPNLLFLTILFLVTAGCSISLSNGNEQYITLYSEPNRNGASMTFGKDYNKYSCNEWKPLPYQPKSVCVNGTWILYEFGNFNTDFERGNTLRLSGENICSELSRSCNVCSLRFVGSFLDYNANTFNLYNQVNFGGDQLMMTNSTPSFETNQSGKSFIITGPSSWTIYDEEHYSGRSYCLKPATNTQVVVAFVPDIMRKPLLFAFHSIRSVRQGCFGK